MEINTYCIIVIGAKIKLQNLFEQSQQILCLIMLTHIIQVQVEEGRSLVLDCAAIKNVKDLFNIASGKTICLFNNLLFA